MLLQSSFVCKLCIHLSTASITESTYQIAGPIRTLAANPGPGTATDFSLRPEAKSAIAAHFWHFILEDDATDSE